MGREDVEDPQLDPPESLDVGAEALVVEGLADQSRVDRIGDVVRCVYLPVIQLLSEGIAHSADVEAFFLEVLTPGGDEVEVVGSEALTPTADQRVGAVEKSPGVAVWTEEVVVRPSVLP